MVAIVGGEVRGGGGGGGVFSSGLLAMGRTFIAEPAQHG